jgi:hypothetical protein
MELHLVHFRLSEQAGREIALTSDGAFGRRVDELLLHRLADLTVRAFLSNLADRLAASTGTRAAPATAPSTPVGDSHRR